MTEEIDDCRLALLAQQESSCDGTLTWNPSIESKLEKEFGRLKDAVYLDHAGATLYSKSQLEACMEDLQSNLYSNPHSRNPSSSITTDAIDNIRHMILRHFNTTESEYTVIFTSGATSAIKIVAECFNYNNGHFIYCEENHTSIIGMREYLFNSGQSDKVYSISKAALDELMGDIFEENAPSHEETGSYSPSLSNTLVAFPAQCNFSGAKYPMKSWIRQIKNGVLNPIHLQSDFFVEPETLKSVSKSLSSCNGQQKFNWFVILDAASFVASSFLDFNEIKPDFVPISFYKMFGYPTGLGALLVRNESSWVLEKSYFGGGTVNISLPSRPFHAKRIKLHEKFEDGTIPFLSILSIKHGFNTLQHFSSFIGDSAAFACARYFFTKLSRLQYPTGNPVAKIYCDTSFESSLEQGPIVTFNLLRMDGSIIGYSEMEQIAYLHNVHLRYGCFCNPGACRRHLDLTPEQVLGHYEAGHVCGDMHDIIDGNPTGAIRASFGYMTSPKNADFLIQLINKCWVLPCYNDQRLYSPLVDQQKEVELSEGEIWTENSYRLTRIFLYPIKSCGSLEVKSSWPIGTSGFLYDREWLITTSGGVPLTAKREPRLCLIKPQIDLRNKLMTLSMPGMDDITVGLEDKPQNDSVSLGVCSSKVCGDTILGYDCGDSVSSWLETAFDKSGLRLIRKCSDFKRQPRNSLDQVSLANQSQYLLLAAPTLRNLAKQLHTKGVASSLTHGSSSVFGDVTMEDVVETLIARFRGNMVVDFAVKNEQNKDIPFSEEKWEDLSIGINQFQSGGPCVRCATICMDPYTGHRSSEPLLTLSEMRSGRPNFGIHLYHKPQSPNNSELFLRLNEPGSLSVGDILKVNKTHQDWTETKKNHSYMNASNQSTNKIQQDELQLQENNNIKIKKIVDNGNVQDFVSILDSID